MGNSNISEKNLYNLEGRVPLGKAILFGMQHVLAMFVSNIVPVMIVCGVAILASKGGKHISLIESAQLIQAAMLVAGIGTIIQLYPIWRIGSGLPVVMGVSFTFLATLISISSNIHWGYEGMIGAIIIGGILEGILGLTAKYWKRFVAPIVSGCVVTTIGFSLLAVGMFAFGGGQGAKDFGSWYHLLIAVFTLISCLVFKYLAKGIWKSLYLLVGIFAGYILCLIFKLTKVLNVVDFSLLNQIIKNRNFINIPKLVFFKYTPTFHIGAIVSIFIIFLVSAAETIGDTTAVCKGGLGRDITEREVSGSLAIDGIGSSISGCFGCCPITSFSQNVGIISLTKIVNKFTVFMGALIMILCSFIPLIGAFFRTLPSAVLGGCIIIMFGSIMFTGMQMIAKTGFSDRNMIIVSISFCVGIGVTLLGESNIFKCMPKIISQIFSNNPVAGVFVVSLLLDLLLPKEKENK